MERALALGGVICALLPSCSVNPDDYKLPQDDDALIEAPVVSDAKAISGGEVTTNASPVALTATDGTGLQLVGYRARAVRQGPLALTDLALTFRNPVNRRIEGRFTINMPTAATISRFAMRIGAKWQEGEVVERQKARVTYESFLHRRRDPALLERNAGAQFRARIFPIEAGATKQIKISYTQELASSETPYRLNLRGLPSVGLLDVKVWDGQRATVLNRRNHQPRKDLVVHGSAAVAGLRSGNLVVARVRPNLPTTQQPINSLLVLIDSSASRAFGIGLDVKRLAALLHQLKRSAGSSLRLKLAAFDQRVAPIFEGPIGSLRGEHLRRITNRGALGASNLGHALRWAAKKDYERVLLVTDAVPTAGATKPAELRSVVARMGLHINRLDLLLTGGIRDQGTAAKLTRSNGLQDGVVLDIAMPAALVAKRLTRATTSKISVAIDGARWVWPERLDGMQRGDEALIYASLAPDALAGGGSLCVRLGGGVTQTQNVELLPVEQPLLQRAAVRARIARLTHLSGLTNDANRQRAYRERIIALSRRFRVLSDHTALLVLETEADYKRFKIDRRALADILVVTEGRPDLLHRSHKGPPPRPRPPKQQPNWLKKKGGGDAAGKMGRTKRRPRAAYSLRGPSNRDMHLAKRLAEDMVKNSGVLGLLEQNRGEGTDNVLGGLIGNQIGAGYGLGGLGLIGRGGGGGDGAVRRRTRGRRVVVGRPKVRGALSKEIIRRIVRRHINEVRYCSTKAGGVNGRVLVDFVIVANGQVERSSVGRSTINNRSVEQCVVGAVRRWLFPKPAGGGTVTVRYPFVFGAGGSSSSKAPRRSFRVPGPSRSINAYNGRMKLVKRHLEAGKAEAALAAAKYWRKDKPADLLALVALGESYRAVGQLQRAARAYGSIIDLFPSRAALRRFAGGRLESLGDNIAGSLAIDTYRKAVEQRPDHATGHRMLGWALLRSGDHAAAFKALVRGLLQRYPSGRFTGVKRIMKEDLGLIGAAWVAADPSVRGEVEIRLSDYNSELPTEGSLRFVLSWETDANDVDLHVYDRHANHAYSANMRYSTNGDLPTGGSIYANVNNGFGPECFAIAGKRRAYPYRLQAHYNRRGAMGYGLGTLQIIEHDGRGKLGFRYRPFVVMNDHAFVELGLLRGSIL